MYGLAHWWFFTRRHHELVEEAGWVRWVRDLRRARMGRRRERSTGHPEVPGDRRTQVRQGLAGDAPRIADLMEQNGVPRWVAFEERFIIAEDEGRLVAILRNREDSECLFLGLLVAEPQGSVAVDLYTGARVMAYGLAAPGARRSRGGPPRRSLHGRPGHASGARVLREAARVHHRCLPRAQDALDTHPGRRRDGALPRVHKPGGSEAGRARARRDRPQGRDPLGSSPGRQAGRRQGRPGQEALRSRRSPIGRG